MLHQTLVGKYLYEKRCKHLPANSDTGKGTVRYRTGHEDPDGEQRYSSTLSSTSALEEGGW